MKVFIGSSTEAKNKGLLNTVALWIEEAGHKPLPWSTPNLFPPGSYILQELQSIASDVGAAMFIFSEDDKTWYRDSERTQPRDNVILEYGLFVGRLDSRRVAICRDGGPAYASDLDGVTYIDLSKPQKCQVEILGWLDNVEKAVSIPGTKTVICHTNKYSMNDSNTYWRTLRSRAQKRLTIVGDTNKSWINRDPVEAQNLADQIINLTRHGNESALVSGEAAQKSTMYFLRNYVIEKANSYDCEAKMLLKKGLIECFTYSVTSKLNYKAVLSDDKLVILPNMVSPEFRDESLVVELNEATHPVEFGYYLQDIRRMVKMSARPELVKEVVNEIET